MADPIDPGTPPGSPPSPDDDPDAEGYHADTEIGDDRQVAHHRHNKLKWVTMVVVSGAILFFGYTLGGFLGSIVWPSAIWLHALLARAGVVAGGLIIAWLIPHRGLLIVAPAQSFITQDPLQNYYPRWLQPPPEVQPAGNMEVYGPGLNPTWLWEGRSVEGNHTLQTITKRFVEEVPSRTSKLIVTVSFQYQARLTGLRQFHQNDESTIEEGIEAFIRSFLSSYLGTRDGTEAKNDIAGINRELARRFRGRIRPRSVPSVPIDTLPPDREVMLVTIFEKGYGIHIVALAVEGIDFPERVQEAIDAREEAAQMRHIIVQNLGIPEDEVAKIAREDKDRYDRLLDKALAQSGNAVMTVNVHRVEGSFPDTIGALASGMLRGAVPSSETTPSSRSPRRRRRRRGSREGGDS